MGINQMKLISNQKNRTALKLIIFFFSISLIAVFIFIQVYYGFYEEFFDLLMKENVGEPPPDRNPEFYKLLLKEDGIVENLTALVLILSGILGIIITTIFFKKRNIKFGILYLLLAVGFLVLGFEEISWGQRIFNLETPELFSSNLQRQIGFHNMNPIYTHLHDFLMMVGFFGAFSWLIFKKLENRYNSFVRIFVPPWYLMFFFFPIFIFYLMGIFMPFDHQRWELGDWLPWNDQELPELVMSFGILLFAMVSFVRQKKLVATIS